MKPLTLTIKLRDDAYKLFEDYKIVIKVQGNMKSWKIITKEPIPVEIYSDNEKIGEAFINTDDITGTGRLKKDITGTGSIKK